MTILPQRAALCKGGSRKKCTKLPFGRLSEFRAEALLRGAARIGQAVTVTLDALPGQSFDGEITEIDPNGENSGGSTKYSVTVTLPRTEDMLTGMNAAVRVQLRENDGRLLIPLAAVQEDANGIYVCTGYDKSSDEATDPIEITTGLSDGENVEVLSGLSEGDTVYYRYADTLEYSFVK